MSGTASTLWYFSDWMSDPNVRSCSLLAKGLWIDLLCLAGMNKGRDHGFITIAGRKPTTEELARQVGATVDDVKNALFELERNAVFNRDRRGIIYCRRMVRAEKNRRNGKLGGKPKHLKNKESAVSLSLVSDTPKARANGNGIGKGKNLESLSRRKGDEERLLFEVEDSQVERVDRGGGWNFDEFWKQYPHKVGKQAAASAFAAAAKKTRANFRDVMIGLMRYAAKTDDRPWCNPSTWLNQHRWLDEPAQAGGRNETVSERCERLADAAREAEFAAGAGRTADAFGIHPSR